MCEYVRMWAYVHIALASSELGDAWRCAEMRQGVSRVRGGGWAGEVGGGRRVDALGGTGGDADGKNGMVLPELHGNV